MKKRTVLLIFSLIILAALIYFSDVEKVALTLSSANIFYIFLGLFMWFLGTFIRTYRWRILLRKAGINVPFRKIQDIYVASMYVSNITPAKTGDPIRSILLRSSNDVPFSKSIPSVIFERIFDIVATAFISFFGVLFLASSIPNLSTMVTGAILIYLTAIIFVLFVFISRARTEVFLGLIFKVFSFIPIIKSHEKDLKSLSENIRSSFSSYKDIFVVIKTLILSVIIWSWEGLILLVAFKSIGIEVSLIASIAIVSITALISVLTFLPGGLGSAEVILVLFFTTLFSIGLPEVTSAALLQRLMSYWAYIVAGTILLNFRLKFK